MYAVATAHPQAVEAGLGVLEKGGDACGAAVTASLVLGVAEPCYSSLGGGGMTRLWREKDNSVSLASY